MTDHQRQDHQTRPSRRNSSSSMSPTSRNERRQSEAHRLALDAFIFDLQMAFSDIASSDPVIFHAALEYFDETHFRDIVEERNVNGLCGHPLCNRPTESFRGKYHISVKDRQVLVSSELNRFCSLACLEATNQICYALRRHQPVYQRIKHVPRFEDFMKGVPTQASIEGSTSPPGAPAVIPARESLSGRLNDLHLHQP